MPVWCSSTMDMPITSRKSLAGLKKKNIIRRQYRARRSVVVAHDGACRRRPVPADCACIYGSVGSFSWRSQHYGKGPTTWTAIEIYPDVLVLDLEDLRQTR